jgi:hypothetical protein
MSTFTTVEKYKRKEDSTFVPSCIMLGLPVKTNLQRLAGLKHTTLSYLLNVAAEEYLRKYIDSQKEPALMIQ